MRCVLAFDLGTSGVKAAAYTEDAQKCAQYYAAYPTFYPGAGRHEQKPQDWWAAVCTASRRILAENPSLSVEGVAVSGHSLGAVPVDAQGNLLMERVPIWSDMRAYGQAERYFRSVPYDEWYRATGNGFPAGLYAIFKIMWLREELPAVYDRTAAFLGTKDYINLKLTGQTATDPSYASGSGVYRLAEGRYDEAYLRASGVQAGKLPCIIDSAAQVGRLTHAAAQAAGLQEGTPVCCGGVDNACMALGANCFRPGDVYASLGTSAWVAVSAAEAVVHPRLRINTWAHCVKGQFLPSAGIFSSGSALNWGIANLLSELGEGREALRAFDALAQTAPAGANGLLFHPGLAGGSNFDASPYVRGGFYGLDLSHTKADVARAMLEGIAFHLKLAYQALGEAVKTQGEEMLLLGGCAKSALWRQIYADVFACGVRYTPGAADAAALGAAALAGTGCGLWNGLEWIARAHGAYQRTAPDLKNVEKYHALLPVYARMAALYSRLGDMMQEGEKTHETI